MSHRDVKPIPTDPAARRERIQWLLDHKVWTHKATVRMPEDTEEMFEPVEGGYLMIEPKDDWPTKEFDKGSLQECWHLDLVFVNPETERIEDDPVLNTALAFRVWIESGPWYDGSADKDQPVPKGGWNDFNRWLSARDIRLDTGGPTMEEALLNLAALVECFYDEDGKDKGMWPCWWGFENDKECEPGEVGEACPKCGFERESDED